MASQRQHHKVNPVCPDGKVRCFKHNVEAVLRTSFTIGNYNRKFWTCPLRPDRHSSEANTESDCGFFFWQDELAGSEHIGTQPSPSTPASSPSRNPLPLATPATPSTIYSKIPTMQRWPGSPNKRGSPFVNTPEAKAKRLKAIQDALPSSSTPPTRPPTLPHVNTGATVAGLGNNPVTPSSSSTAQKSRRLEAIRQGLQTPESPTKSSANANNSSVSTSTLTSTSAAASRSFTSTLASSSSNASASGTTNGRTESGTVYKLENLGINLDGPRPTVPNPMFQSMGIGRQLDTTESEDELWIHLSPPTSQDEVAADLLSDEPIASASMKVDKGKQRASDEEQRQEEEKKKEDAFWTSPATKRQNVLFTSTADPTASPAASTSTTVNNSSSNDLTGERIEQIVQANMEGLQGLQGIPAYVRKLERKLLASQNSNDYKAKKIQELEAELRELKSTRRME